MSRLRRAEVFERRDFSLRAEQAHRGRDRRAGATRSTHAGRPQREMAERREAEGACATPTGARTSSSPRWRTSCATRSRRSATRSRSAGARGDDPTAVAEARAIIERQVAQMVRLVDDLLDVSRITTGKLTLRKEHVRCARRGAERHRGDRAARPRARARAARGAAAAGRGARRRSDAPRAGVPQPAEQRRQVHRPRRAHRLRGRGDAGRARRARARQRRRHRPRDARGDLRDVRAGRPLPRALDHGPRRRPVAGAAPGRAARRHDQRLERRPGQGLRSSWCASRSPAGQWFARILPSRKAEACRRSRTASCSPTTTSISRAASRRCCGAWATRCASSTTGRRRSPPRTSSGRRSPSSTSVCRS